MPFLQEFFTMLKKMVMARSVNSVDLIFLFILQLWYVTLESLPI